MSSRNGRVPGTASTRSFAVPRCSVHLRPCVRGPEGFFCPDCMNDWLQETGQQVEVAQILPNRRARRMVMRG